MGNTGTATVEEVKREALAYTQKNEVGERLQLIIFKTWQRRICHEY